MNTYLIRLNDCPLFELKVPATAAVDEWDVRLLAREWLLGRPLPDEVELVAIAGPTRMHVGKRATG
jgi:hypothetical protein